MPLALMGDRAGSIKPLKRSREACGSDPELIAFCDSLASYLEMLYGDTDNALASARASVNGCEVKGTAYCRAMAHQALSHVLLHLGDYAESAEAASYALEIVRANNTGRTHYGLGAGTLALAELALGKPEQAYSRSLETVAFCRTRELYWDLTPWEALVRSSIALGKRDEAVPTG